jgi:hypothetical protein
MTIHGRQGAQLGATEGSHRIRKAILDFVSESIGKSGFAPSIREIGAAVGIASTSQVVGHLDALVSLGLLERTGSTARALALGRASITDMSFMCHAATRWGGTEVADHLHEACPGHVFQAWDQWEFECECGCHVA